MALVVFLRGVNVGGSKTFRPSALAKELRRFDVVNIGAAGTFVVRKEISPTKLRGEIARRLPFQAEVMICHGRDILELVADDPFARRSSVPNVVRFVSVLAKRPPTVPSPLPTFPSDGNWGLRVVACQQQFVLGLYRREMKAIGYLGRLDKVFGAPVTTRNWNTILAIARILKDG